MEMPKELTDEERRGAQFVMDWLDDKFNLWQDDATHYHITIYRHDFHKFINKYRLNFKGGW